LKSWIL